MRTVLVLGGAECVWDDVAAYGGPRDGVVACNDIGAEWPGDLDAWVSLHVRFMLSGPRWLEQRRANGHPEPRRIFGHPAAWKGKGKQIEGIPREARPTPYTFQIGDRSGSSGLYAAKVALIDLGFDRVVLCGVPMTPMAHAHGAENWKNGQTVGGFRNGWHDVPLRYRARMTSMSGWTRDFLGAPEMEAADG